MKIKKVQFTNLGCYKGINEFTLPDIGALIQPNGTGKTTFLNGLIYAITGKEPDGDMITKGCPECDVSLFLEDGGVEYEFTRIKFRDKSPSKFKINGKATTQKSLNGKISDLIGIPVERVKIAASSGVIANLGPEEFGDFLLQYIPEKLTLADVKALISSATPGMTAIMEENLPEDGIDIDTIDTFNDVCRTARKDLKATLQAKKLLLSEKPEEKPKESEKQLRDRLAEIAKAEAAKSVYAEQKKAYDDAVLNKKKAEENIARLEKEISSITASRPDPAQIDKAIAEKDDIQKTVVNNNIAMTGAKNAIAQLKSTLDALDKPVCPISPLIVCHEDKSEAKAEIEESIQASEDGVKALSEENEKAEARLKKAEEKILSLQDEKNLYEKKISLMKQLTAVKDMIPDIPKEPEKIEEIDADTEKFQINEKLKTIESLKEVPMLKSQIETLEQDISDYDTLVKATAEKGEVREGVVKKFLGVFEEIINDRSKEFRPDIEFRLEAKNGVRVEMVKKGVELSYDEISGGEKAYLVFMVMDMLNALSGINLMFIDEASVMDMESFNAMLDIAVKHRSEYDHILIASVNHDDTVKAVKDHKIPIMA